MDEEADSGDLVTCLNATVELRLDLKLSDAKIRDVTMTPQYFVSEHSHLP